MNFCHGGELLTFINDRGPFSEIKAREMMRQLLNALKRMQELGVAHRDLSLENILYDEEKNRFTIIDFGMCLRCPRAAQSILNPPPVIDASCFSLICRRPPCGKRHYIAPGRSIYIMSRSTICKNNRCRDLMCIWQRCCPMPSTSTRCSVTSGPWGLFCSWC